MQGAAVLIFTAYTPAYREYAEALDVSCQLWGFALFVIPIPESGSWVKNCARKGHLCDATRGQSSGPILWLDADAEVRRSLDGLDALCEGYDVAHGARGKKVLSGTVWLADTPKASELCEDWAARCTAEPQVWDQRHLADAIEATGVKALALPPAYCYIDTISAREHPDVEPIIYHKQASRVMKAKVGR